MELKRVVVTGMGVVTSLGLTLDAFWSRLLRGKSGISAISQFDVTEFTSQIAGELQDFNPTDHLSRKESRHMDRFSQFAMLSAASAIENSRLDLDAIDRDRFGVIWGSGIGGMMSFEKECGVLHSRGPKRVSPFLIPMLIPDIAPGHISIKYRFRGVNYATVSACASSAHAIGDAFNHIRHGRATGVLAGGSEAPITPLGLAGFCSLKALSTRNDDPAHASRPFDLHRDGFVMGEGSGSLILEELEHAKARGAHIYGEIVGVGYTADAHHITQPVPGGEGAARAMRLAVEDAGIEPSEIGYVNAHGTSTPFNDKTETAAIKTTFGDHAENLAISSTKSMTGHLLGASGAVESIATLLSLENGILHPTANLTIPDPECDLFYCPDGPVERPVTYAVSNSFGFGGHNVSLVYKKA